MATCQLALCESCGKVWVICSTGQHEEWRIMPLLPEYIVRMAPKPINPKQALKSVVSGETEVDWGAVRERRSFIVAASEPFCPDDGETFIETYAHDAKLN